MSERLNVIAGRHVHEDNTLSEKTYTWFLPKWLDNVKVGNYVYAATRFGVMKVVVTERIHWDKTIGREPKLQSVVKIVKENPKKEVESNLSE